MPRPLSEGLKDYPFWKSGTNDTNADDQKAYMIAEKMLFLHVDTTSDVADVFTNFSEEVMERVSGWPFYCTNCSRGQEVS